MLKIDLYKNKNQNQDTFGKVYGRVDNNAPIGIKELAEHMAEHRSKYSMGDYLAIITDMAACIKELMLQGQPVKLDDLCIFYASALSAPADSVEKFELGEHIKSIRLCARATGELRQKELTKRAILGYTTMAEKLKKGEAELSSEKKKYLKGAGGAASQG